MSPPVRQPGVYAVTDQVFAATARIRDVLDGLPHPAPAVARARAMPPWRAEEYVAARSLLQFLLHAVDAPRSTRELDLGTDHRGKPFLPCAEQTGVSLSHCGPVVAAAVAIGHPVGVDVQQTWQPGPLFVRRCCHGRAAEELAEAPARLRPRLVARIWAAQEACVKATGAGLAGAPWRIPVRPLQRTGRWQELRWFQLTGPASSTALCCAIPETPAPMTGTPTEGGQHG